MGNCGASRHAVESWADDGEWQEGDEASSGEGDHNHGRTQPEHVSEVTIRITRRKLHELMERTKQQQVHDAAGLVARSRRQSTEQLLADIMNSGEVHHHAEEHWHWKPALQSIPEAAAVES